MKRSFDLMDLVTKFPITIPPNKLVPPFYKPIIREGRKGREEREEREEKERERRKIERDERRRGKREERDRGRYLSLSD